MKNKSPSENEKKPRRWLFPLITALILLTGLAIAAACLLPGLKTGWKAYDLLKAVADRPELSMELTVNAQVDGKETNLTARITKQQVDGYSVVAVESGPLRMYFAEGAVFLENGTAYQISAASPDYSGLLDQALMLYQAVDISEADGTYTITAEKETAQTILNLLMPSAFDEFADAQTLTVELVTQENTVTQLRFHGAGNLADGKGSAFDLSAVLVIDPEGTEPLPIPQSVIAAIQQGPPENIASFTEDIGRLFLAWRDLNNREPLAAVLKLSADCGPLTISDQLELYRVTRDSLQIGVIRKNSHALYFTDSAVCDQYGNLLNADRESTVEAAKLPEILCGLCMNAELDCTENGGQYTYSLSLDEEGMKAVAYAVAPEAENLDVFFDTGTIRLVIADNKLCSLSVSCQGSLQILLSNVDVQIGAEIEIQEADAGITIPEEVYLTLKKTA